MSVKTTTTVVYTCERCGAEGHPDERGPFWGRHAALTVREVCRDWYGNAAGGTDNYDLCDRCSGDLKKWLYSLDDCEYSQGIANDGPAILRDGIPMTPEEIVARLNGVNNATSGPNLAQTKKRATQNVT